LIITRTPFRVSFIGGGSDMPDFYTKHPGAVLSTTINKYMYISSHRYFEPDQIRVKYSKTETVKNVADLQHPILREVLNQFGIGGGLEVSSIADVPSGTGLGSSSSFTVGLIHNLSVNRNRPVTKDFLAIEACRVEIDLLKEPIGKQDQYAAAVGGLNVFEFKPNGDVTVEPFHQSKEVLDRLEKNLVMFYTGDQRSASNILAEQKKNINDNAKFQSLQQMVALVSDARQAILTNRLDDFGKILHENWLLKKSLASGISNDNINQAYEAALKAGAIGGKLLGAGGGGFLLFYVPEQAQKSVIESLKALRKFDFKFEQEGSKLIHYSDE
jgi:D-glycero-alpha-D-manno-heptose-7-phosphate kinase